MLHNVAVLIEREPVRSSIKEVRTIARATSSNSNLGNPEFSATVKETVEVSGSLLVVVLARSAEQIEVAINEVAIEDGEWLCKIACTSFEVRIVDVSQSIAVGIGLLQTTVVFQKFEEVVRSSKSEWRILFPTSRSRAYGRSDEGYATILLHQLEISPSTHELHLSQLTAHIVTIVLQCHRVHLREVEVALVDYLVVGCTVQQFAATVGKVAEIDDVVDGVVGVLRSGDKVASQFAKQDVLLYHALKIAQDTEVEIDSVTTREVLCITVNIGSEHIFTRSGECTKAYEGENQRKK